MAERKVGGVGMSGAQQEGPARCRGCGVAEIVPPHPADGLGLGSPAVSATTALPIPWEPAIEPTPTPLPHPVKIDNAWRNLQKIAPIVERTATGVRESTDRILLLSYDRSIFVDADV